MRKLKILHVITHLEVGGAQDNTFVTCEYLDKSKYDVTLAVNARGYWSERVYSINKLKLIHIPHLCREIDFRRDILAFWSLYKHIRENRYDIVHTHSSKPGAIARLAAWCLHYPIIIHTIHGFSFHDFMPSWKRFFFILIEKALSVITDKIITVSKLNLRKLVSLRIAPLHKCVNIYSGISFKKFDYGNYHRGKLRRQLGVNNETKIIGMVGRLSYQKSPETLIQALPIVVENIHNIHVVLVGDGELRPMVEDLIKQLLLQEKVTILGFRNDIPSLLKEFDIYVLSSIYEGLGRSLTEAMYCKVPVVATEVEGVPELVKNHETGILVPPDDATFLANGVIYLLEHPDKARIMAQKAHDKVTLNFGIEKMIEDIDELYHSYAKKFRRLKLK